MSHTGSLGRLSFSAPHSAYNSLRARNLGAAIGLKPVLAMPEITISGLTSSPLCHALDDIKAPVSWSISTHLHRSGSSSWRDAGWSYRPFNSRHLKAERCVWGLEDEEVEYSSSRSPSQRIILV